MTYDRKQTLSILWSQSFQFPKGSFANSKRMLFETLWNHSPMFKVWRARSLCIHHPNALIRCSTFFIFLQQYIISYLTRHVSHHGLAIYIQRYLKAKEELWKIKYFTMQKCNLQKNSLKVTKIFQDIITQ